jgi:hypothetical protein
MRLHVLPILGLAACSSPLASPSASPAADASAGDASTDLSASDQPATDAPMTDAALPDAPAADAPEEPAPTWPDPHCLPVLAGHNADDPSRINVVLLYAGFDAPDTPMHVPHLFEGLVGGTTDNSYSFDPQLAPLYAVEGLAGIEPFSSNFDRFNFWYVDLPLYGSGDLCPWLDLPPDTTCAGNVLTTVDKDGNLIDTVLSPEDVVPLSAAGKACDLPNRYVDVVYAPTNVMNESTFPRPGNYAVFGSYAQQVLMFGATTSINLLFEGFVHEFVHAVGQVWDEKGDHSSSADYPGTIFGPNCFSKGPSEPMTPAQCAASPDLPWHDLIGNGCGQDGVVDCPVTRSYHDPTTNQDCIDRFDEWIYEVRDDVDGCGQGCLYTQGNIFRPFQACDVMSSCDLTTETRTGIITRLGPVNEREVCRRILAITGGVSTWCEKLCLAGCPSGKRCIQGTCVDP